MQLQSLGRSGLQVSVVGLGCNNFGKRLDLAGARRVVDAALDAGITLFDTADVYGERGGSEAALGEILGARRQDIVLATKFGMPMDEQGTRRGAARGYIVKAVEASLRRLKTDWIDLYQLHRPDPRTPIEETLSALDDLVRAGKVRYLGCSNLAAWQLVDAQWTARQRHLHGFIAHQDEYSLLNRDIERELLPAAKSLGVGLLPYFPLASGLLTGKYQPGVAPPPGTRLAGADRFAQQFLNNADWPLIASLQSFAAARGRRLLDLAVAWLVAQGAASVIAGATQPEQVVANVKAAEWTLTATDLTEIDGLIGR